ncbi:cysteine peptidase family C39 domain-containing protein [Chitinophaga silvatica]|nr:cysteine peptidase family C39 domain-containing protein [Chitinophaga silvatica]
MQNLLLPTDNSIVTFEFLKQLKVKVTFNSVKEAIHTHPNYPSLLSNSDSLKKWNIESTALKVPLNHFEELPLPFLTFLKKNGRQFILVTEMKNESIRYIDTQGIKKWITRDYFLQKWESVVLLAEGGITSGEANYKVARRNEVIKKLHLIIIIHTSLFQDLLPLF